MNQHWNDKTSRWEPQTNADRLRAKLQDDTELAKSRIRREGSLYTALDVPGYVYTAMLDAVQDELDWLRQPVEGE